MFIPAKLLFRSYMPKELEPGMWFINKKQDVVYGNVYNYLEIIELKAVPRNKEQFLEINGAPVEPYIVSQMVNSDDKEIILATPEQIGWWDAGDHSEDLTDIDIPTINFLLEEWDGDVAIEMTEDAESAIVYEGKVTLRTIDNMPDDEEWDNDEEDYTGWSADDDEPEEDGAGFTINDR